MISRHLTTTIVTSLLLILLASGCARYQRYELEVLPDADAPRWVVLDRKTGETRMEVWTSDPQRYEGWGIVRMDTVAQDSQSH